MQNITTFKYQLTITPLQLIVKNPPRSPSRSPTHFPNRSLSPGYQGSSGSIGNPTLANTNSSSANANTNAINNTNFNTGANTSSNMQSGNAQAAQKILTLKLPSSSLSCPISSFSQQNSYQLFAQALYDQVNHKFCPIKGIFKIYDRYPDAREVISAVGICQIQEILADFQATRRASQHKTHKQEQGRILMKNIGANVVKMIVSVRRIQDDVKQNQVDKVDKNSANKVEQKNIKKQNKGQILQIPSLQLAQTQKTPSQSQYCSQKTLSEYKQPAILPNLNFKLQHQNQPKSQNVSQEKNVQKHQQNKDKQIGALMFIPNFQRDDEQDQEKEKDKDKQNKNIRQEEEKKQLIVESNSNKIPEPLKMNIEMDINLDQKINANANSDKNSQKEAVHPQLQFQMEIQDSIGSSIGSRGSGGIMIIDEKQGKQAKATLKICLKKKQKQIEKQFEVGNQIDLGNSQQMNIQVISSGNLDELPSQLPQQLPTQISGLRRVNTLHSSPKTPIQIPTPSNPHPHPFPSPFPSPTGSAYTPPSAFPSHGPFTSTFSARDYNANTSTSASPATPSTPRTGHSYSSIFRYGKEKTKEDQEEKGQGNIFEKNDYDYIDLKSAINFGSSQKGKQKKKEKQRELSSTYSKLENKFIKLKNNRKNKEIDDNVQMDMDVGINRVYPKDISCIGQTTSNIVKKNNTLISMPKINHKFSLELDEDRRNFQQQQIQNKQLPDNISSQSLKPQPPLNLQLQSNTSKQSSQPTPQPLLEPSQMPEQPSQTLSLPSNSPTPSPKRRPLPYPNLSSNLNLVPPNLQPSYCHTLHRRESNNSNNSYTVSQGNSEVPSQMYGQSGTYATDEKNVNTTSNRQKQQQLHHSQQVQSINLMNSSQAVIVDGIVGIGIQMMKQNKERETDMLKENDRIIQDIESIGIGSGRIGDSIQIGISMNSIDLNENNPYREGQELLQQKLQFNINKQSINDLHVKNESIHPTALPYQLQKQFHMSSITQNMPIIRPRLSIEIPSTRPEIPLSLPPPLPSSSFTQPQPSFPQSLPSSQSIPSTCPETTPYTDLLHSQLQSLSTLLLQQRRKNHQLQSKVEKYVLKNMALKKKYQAIGDLYQEWCYYGGLFLEGLERENGNFVVEIGGKGGKGRVGFKCKIDQASEAIVRKFMQLTITNCNNFNNNSTNTSTNKNQKPSIFAQSQHRPQLSTLSQPCPSPTNQYNLNQLNLPSTPTNLTNHKLNLNLSQPSPSHSQVPHQPQPIHARLHSESSQSQSPSGIDLILLRIESTYNENTRLKKLLLASQSQLSTLQSQFSSLSSTHSSTMSTLSSLSLQMSSLQSQFSALSSQSLSQKQKIQQLQYTLQLKQQAIHSLHKSMERLNTEYEQIQDQLMKERAECQNRGLRIGEMEEQLEDREEVIEVYKGVYGCIDRYYGWRRVDSLVEGDIGNEHDDLDGNKERQIKQGKQQQAKQFQQQEQKQNPHHLHEIQQVQEQQYGESSQTRPIQPVALVPNLEPRSDSQLDSQLSPQPILQPLSSQTPSSPGPSASLSQSKSQSQSHSHSHSQNKFQQNQLFLHDSINSMESSLHFGAGGHPHPGLNQNQNSNQNMRNANGIGIGIGQSITMSQGGVNSIAFRSDRDRTERERSLRGSERVREKSQGEKSGDNGVKLKYISRVKRGQKPVLATPVKKDQLSQSSPIIIQSSNKRFSSKNVAQMSSPSPLSWQKFQQKSVSKYHKKYSKQQIDKNKKILTQMIQQQRFNFLSQKQFKPEMEQIDEKSSNKDRQKQGERERQMSQISSLSLELEEQDIKILRKQLEILINKIELEAKKIQQKQNNDKCQEASINLNQSVAKDKHSKKLFQSCK